jgi:glycosyltransferase involved in cell wall biosynthesis
VIPNGIDPVGLLGLQPGTQKLMERFQLDTVDAFLLAPVRITKRKNLEWALEAAATVRASGRTVRLLISGPPGPHNPKSMEYVEELHQLRRALKLEDSVSFLFEELSRSSPELYPVDSATLRDLYILSDVVVLPSSGEGFGLPLAEAALFRVPVVCTDLPSFRELAPEGVRYVAVDSGSNAFSAAVLDALDESASKLRRNLIRRLSWDRILREELEPLLLKT